MQLVPVLALVFLFAHVALASAQPQPVSTSDPAMNAAVAQAQKSLDNFLKLKSSPPSGTSQFTVKVVLFAQGEAREHMWVMPFRAAPGVGFEGILQNDARFISTLHRGKQVRFSREQITDWGHSKDGTLHGFFTVCAMFARAPEQRTQLEASGQRYACAP